MDLDEVCSVPEHYVPEEKYTHEECWKTILSTTLKGNSEIMLIYLVTS